MGKRAFDILSSGMGLLFLAPIFGIIAIVIRMDSPGPVFYVGKRVGRNGGIFDLYKFRTMVDSAERLGGVSTADDDPRITRAGCYLRKWKLDELPQLINVFVGHMSLVGPRPDIESYVERYAETKRRVLSIRPGITDWATIWNANEGAILAGLSNPDRAYDELILPTKLQLQLRYVENRSFWTDLTIIFHTWTKILYRGWTPSALADCPDLETLKKAWLQKEEKELSDD